MNVAALRYHAADGWTCEVPGELDSEQTLVLVFGAPEFGANPEPLNELRNRFPNSRITGCSTAGEIHGVEIFDHSLSAIVMQFEHTRVVASGTEVNSPDESRSAGQILAASLRHEDLRGVLVLSDGLRVNGSELVRGINSELDPSVVVTGGLAGDGEAFENTWVLYEGEPRTGVVSAIGLYGDRVHVGHGSKGGWDYFGPERTVTRSEGNVLYELDGKPALELYKRYLGDRAVGLPATALLFPLSLRVSDSEDHNVVRTILAVDEDEQSMTFAGDVPQDSLVKLMRANFDRLVLGASVAARLAEPDDEFDEVVSIAVSCVGRRMVLGERTEEEIEAALDILPSGTHQVGFYSYGEISPYADGRCDLHNQTMTLTTIAER